MIDHAPCAFAIVRSVQCAPATRASLRVCQRPRHRLQTIEVLLGLGGGALLARVPCMLAPAVPVCERHQPSIGPYPSLSRIVRLECHVR